VVDGPKPSPPFSMGAECAYNLPAPYYSNYI
jgi:hypothetical protein